MLFLEVEKYEASYPFTEGLYDWRNEATDKVEKQRSLALKQKMCRLTIDE